MSIKDLEAFLDNPDDNDRSLEEYLRALWKLIEAHQSQQISWSLMTQLFKTAFTSEPADFDSDWLQYTAPPEQGDDDLKYLKLMILHQIADLRRMQEAGILDLSGEKLYTGVVSPTGHSWYNFAPVDFLLHAGAGFGFSRVRNRNATWKDMGVLLYLGQIYE